MSGIDAEAQSVVLRCCYVMMLAVAVVVSAQLSSSKSNGNYQAKLSTIKSMLEITGFGGNILRGIIWLYDSNITLNGQL